MESSWGVRSLSYATDLRFIAFDGKVTDRGDYVVAETPGNPTFYWGNFLLFRSAPRAATAARWLELFREELRHVPRVRHVAFAWDTEEPGEIDAFRERGFELEEGVTLSTTEVHPPPRFDASIEVRLVRTDAEWDEVTAAQIACRAARFDRDDYERFKVKQMVRYRAMVDRGLGQWFAAFVDGRIAADLGLFVFDGLGRFQVVETLPEHRRRGLCGALVYHASRHALAELGAERLVIAAEEHYHAVRIYESVGFRRTERLLGLFKAPPP